jgi:hypothetical protein
VLRVALHDRPGELHRLTGVLAELGLNVVDIEHHRSGVHLPVDEVEVHMTLETRDPEHRAEVLEGLRALAAAWPVSPQPSILSAAPEEFVVPNTPLRLTTTDPLIKALLMALCESWPRSVPVPELWTRVDNALASRPDVPRERSPQGFRETLLSGFGNGILELHVTEPSFAMDISERPVASPYARRESREGNLVTNLRHRIVELGPFDRLVVERLDGTRDRADLIDELVAAALDGTFPLHRDGQPVTDAMEVRQIIERSLDPSLLRLRGSTLLVA